MKMTASLLFSPNATGSGSEARRTRMTRRFAAIERRRHRRTTFLCVKFEKLNRFPQSGRRTCRATDLFIPIERSVGAARRSKRKRTNILGGKRAPPLPHLSLPNKTIASLFVCSLASLQTSMMRYLQLSCIEFCLLSEVEILWDLAVR